MRQGLALASWLLLIVLLGPSLAYAEDAHSWLKRMNAAVHGLNYTGTYVYISGDQIDTMQIVHRADESGEHERLLSLNGEAREILRNSEQVTCILPADRSVIIGQHKAGSGLPALVPGEVLEFSKLYELELIGRDRIAGHPAIILSIEPKDKMRYGYRIWLEEDSAMVLRSDILDASGKVMEQMMFTELTMQSPVSPHMLEPTVDYSQFKVITDHLAQAKSMADIHDANWSFEQMPKGFKIASQSVKTMPMKKYPVKHFVLTDGLATVSVYIEKSGIDEQMLEGESSMGSVNAYGRQIADHRVTVMGEVPRDTVRQIAEAVARN